MGRSFPRLTIALLSAVLLVPQGPEAAPRESATRASGKVLAAVVLADERPETREEAIAAVRAAGGRVAHQFDGLLVVEAPPESVRGMLPGAAVKEVGTDAVSASRHRRRPEGFHAGLSAWNRFFKNQDRRFALISRPGEPIPPMEGEDSWFPPVARPLDGGKGFPAPDGAVTLSETAPVCAATSATQPYGATDQNTSEFLAGIVSVNVFLVESDGTVDLQTESWSAEREQAVVAQVAAGLDWLREQEPAARLTFVYHVIAGRTEARARTGYEPITRKADPMGTTGEDLWVGRILTNMGYTSGDRWTRSRALANDTRRADKADWGVNVFVADSLNDTDGRFVDGHFAYAWVGGPHLVMTYDNQAWGIDRMNQVLRHEFLHQFYAFDEYTGSSCTCTEHRGYLDGANSNCRTCNSQSAYCVMESNGAAMCNATRRQVGWADLDGDAAADVIGEDPGTFVDTLPATVCDPVELSGQGAVVAATNRNPAGITPKVSISVNRLSGVEWRANGGPWAPADPTDGEWGDYVEAWKAVAHVGQGLHTIEIRAVDDHGNADVVASAVTIGVNPGASDPGDVVSVQRAAGGAATVSWSGAPPAEKYRVYRSASASGAFALAAESALTTWTDPAAGNGYYLVRAVDACGAESTP